MTVQLAPAAIFLDGFLIGYDNTDLGGFGVAFTTIDGWYGGLASRAAFTDRPNDHGSFDAPVYRASRVVSITGTVYADDRATVAVALHSMCGKLAEGQAGTLTVNDPDYGNLSAQVRLTDGPQVNWNTRQLAWDWQIQLTAVDPRKYADPVSATTGLPGVSGDTGLAFDLFDVTGMLEFGAPAASGQVTLDNPGSADTYATFSVVGPVIGGLSLTDVSTGRSIVYAGDVPGASTLLIIDSAYGRATLNGSDRTGLLTSKQWWPVKAGASSTVQFATAGASGQTGRLTATVRPAYW